MTTKTPTKTRGSKRSSKARPAPTLGPLVCRWIETYLVHAEGDYFGRPFQLRPWQVSFVNRAYELMPDGSRRYDRGLLGLSKGNGKTELAAAIACAELGGPVAFDGWRADGHPRGTTRVSPDIPVAAASFEQADTLFGAAGTMIREGPLDEFFEVYDTEIQPKGDRPGRLYRVAAVAGTNDGRRPSFFVADELHEWVGKRERVHLVLSNGRAKRADAWELGISTAGWDIGSLLGRLYMHGRRVREGEVDDPRMLFEWVEAPEDLELDDPEQLEEAVRAANPAAGDFLPLDSIVQRYHEIAEHEFRRYYLNQWTSSPERWMPAEEWGAVADPEREIEPGTRIALGFDGSYNRDSTALLGCTTEDPHLFVLGAWERPDGVAEWSVDRDEVVQAIEDAVANYDVVAMAADDTFGRIWSMDLEELAERGVPIVEWPTRSRARMAPACGQFYGAIRDRRLSHDGDELLAEHIGNCIEKGTAKGPVITKEHKDSERRIDLAVAAIIAYDMAVRQPEDERSTYEDHGLTVLG